LLSYDIDESRQVARMAFYVDKILRGAKASDLPIEQPTTFRLIISLATAKTLGITIPESLLLRADEVIQ
jgi:putative ABC transport system substrate-binding protein